MAEHRGYQFVMECDENGWYAFVPGLMGCQSQGVTEREAEANVREAVDLYIESLGSGG